MTVTVNDKDVTGQSITYKKVTDRGTAAWVGGVRLKPGDVLSINGTIVHIEPPSDFTDPNWDEHEVF
jgi:hypothetical protein